MFKKNLFLLMLVAVQCSQVSATEMQMQDMMDMPEDMMQMTEAEVRSCKCKNFRCINVCGAARVGGNLTVGGSVTANSFITPEGPLFNGLRSYAVFANQDDTATDGIIPWNATTAPNVGITNAAGVITLPETGVFLVQYSVRFNVTADGDPSTATAHLEQGPVPTPISQAAITRNTAPSLVDGPDIEITGYALITTNPGNNTIDLRITFDQGFSFPDATGSDANAQMTILQLN